MNKKQAISYAQIALNYMQSSKYKGEINHVALGLEMKQAFRLYSRDIIVNIAEAQLEAIKKLSLCKESDNNEWFYKYFWLLFSPI